MTQFFLPPKFTRAPELLIPGRKPAGPVQIDWTHPAAPDKHAYLFDHSIPPVNLVDGSLPTVQLESTSTITTGIGIKGMYQFFDPASNADIAGYAVNPIGSMPSGYICARVLSKSVSNENRDIFSHGDYASGHRIYFYQFADSFGIRLGASTASETSNTIYANTWYDIVSTWSGTNCESYVDGVNIDSYTFSGTPGSTDDATAIAHYHDGTTDALSLGFDGYIAHLFVGTQRLSDALAVSLCRNPYQFLIPA